MRPRFATPKRPSKLKRNPDNKILAPAASSLEARRLFQLEENFRMNEPLTAYPRDVLYRGRFVSTRPDIRIQTAPELEEESEEIIETILHPACPVVLCWYTSPRSFTARNPIEAELVALLTDRLSQTLLQEMKDKRLQPYSPEDFVRCGLAVLAPHRAQNSAIRQALAAQGVSAVLQRRSLAKALDICGRRRLRLSNGSSKNCTTQSRP